MKTALIEISVWIIGALLAAWIVLTFIGCAAEVPPRIGETGSRGPAGVAGPQGPAGKDGKDAPSAWRPLAHFSCLVTIDLISVSNNGEITRASDGLKETVLSYEATRYTNGDAETKCTASIGSAQNGSDSEYYPATVPGAGTESCFASADYPGSAGGGSGTTVGKFEFSANRLPQAVYNDPDNPLMLNGSGYKFADSDCAVFDMDDKGDWTRITLGALP